MIQNTVGYQTPVINIDVNSLNQERVKDYGRSTGPVDLITAYIDNHGPLIRENKLANNSLNGMEVRAATLTTEGVWDDTDIVHVLFDDIAIPNVHTFGGLRLESSSTESLVVKMQGNDAGFHATGMASDYEDRIGGMLHILGQPGHPVVLTSLGDDSVGAGFDPAGRPQFDTDGPQRPERTQLPGSFQIDLNFGPVIRLRPHIMDCGPGSGANLGTTGGRSDHRDLRL